MTNRAPRPLRRPKPTREAEPLAEWTVMIYLAGDNNLSAECVWALTEMQRGMSSDKVKVIAQFDPNDGLARTRRYEITSAGVINQQDGADDGKQPIPEEPSELDGLAKDVAGWNPRTEEVHFNKESWNARYLASLRHKRQKAKWRYAERMVAKGEGLNADLEPDDLGASRNDTDAASPITLYNFLSFGIEFYPARHYMVVLSGHSAGIEPSYLLRDDSSGGAMTFRQLRVVFDQLQHDLKGHKDQRATQIDILGFDTCLMSMAEVCCDLKDRVGIVIGSETYTPASGWPYQSILKQLCESTKPALGSTKAKPFTARQLAEVVVTNYVDFYKQYVSSGVSAALSALDVTKVGGLAPVVKKLTRVLLSELKAEHPELKGKRELQRRPFTDALVLAHWEAQSYNGEWYVDLIDFCECLSKRTTKTTVRAACQAVIDFLIAKQFVIRSEYCGPTYQYSNGVAIYFPWSSVATYFWGFEFARLSGWGDFLAYYTNVTRRKFRVPEKLSADEQRKILEFEKGGGNFLNYARNADKMASDKRASDKRASDKGLDWLVFNKMASDKRASDKRASDKMASDKMASDKMGSDKSGNPIHSMRNPPVVSLDFDF